MSAINQFTIERSDGTVTASASPLIVYNDIVPFSVALTDSAVANVTAFGETALTASLRLGSSTGTVLASCYYFTLVDGVKSGRFELSKDAQELLFGSADGVVYVEFILSEETGPRIRYLLASSLNVAAGRPLPVTPKSEAYTLTASDAGSVMLHPSADGTVRTYTIPAGLSVGTALTFVNQNGAGVLTIASASDTVRLAGAGTTGNRALAANGIATAIKVAATEWIISGTGLS